MQRDTELRRQEESRAEGHFCLGVGEVSAYVEAGESMVERMRTISARWVGDMCWVMWTMESMATSGLAWTKLGRAEKRSGRVFHRSYVRHFQGRLGETLPPPLIV